MQPRATASLDQTVPIPRSSRRARRAQPLLKIVQSLLLSKELWFQNVLAFLAARAAVLGELYPFGAAFFVAVLVSGSRKRSVAAAFSVALGSLTVMTPMDVAFFSGAMLLALVASVGAQRKASRRRTAKRAVINLLFVTALLGVGRAAPGWLYGASWFDSVSVAVEGGLIAIVALILAPAAAANWFERRRYDRSSLLALGLTTAVAGLGLQDVQWGWVLLPELWNRWVILLAALIAGAAGGAAMGTTIGVLTSLTGWIPLGGMGLYGVSGLFAGLFARSGKFGAVVGFVLGHMVVAIHATGAGEILWGAGHTGVAAALLLLVPRRWVERMRRGIPGSDAAGALQLLRERRLRAAISDRLGKVSSVFAELADVFNANKRQGVDPQGVEEGVNAIVQDTWTRRCQSCPQFKECWERSFYNSFWETVDLIAVAERKGRATVDDLPQGMRERCIAHDEFVAAINDSMESNAGGNWHLEREQAMDIVPYQLKGAAELVERVADQISLESSRAEALEERVWEEFALRRIDVRHLTVSEHGEHPEIEVEYAGECDGYGECAVTLLAAIERVTNEAYTCELQCRSGLEETCRVRLAPEHPFELDVKIARLAKGGGSLSGDTCSHVQLGGGKTALMLSDGMGSGDRASTESRATVGMLEKMMRAGFDRSFAVRTINSVLLLRSTEEMFATLDLAVIDEFSGELEFLKVGSAPTFIKRERDVEIVRSDSLPIGILSEIDLRANTRSLASGDVLVMMTDGILDALPDRADKEEWIARLLRRVESTDPKELVRLLVDRAKQVAEGEIDDDMTVIVARLQERRARADETDWLSVDEYADATSRTG